MVLMPGVSIAGSRWAKPYHRHYAGNRPYSMALQGDLHCTMIVPMSGISMADLVGPSHITGTIPAIGPVQRHYRGTPSVL